jgi:pSer/pThr/pTyr-binding forkhead associated (FHA) protein
MSGLVFLALRIILVICLYAFLAWAFYTMWNDLKRQSEVITFNKVPALTLTRLDGAGKFRFSKAEVHIGRDPACDCLLEDQTVSSQHAFLSFHHNQWWLEDLGSTNGTFLNRLPVTSPMVVTIGDQIRCGQVNLDITIDGGETKQEQ